MCFAIAKITNAAETPLMVSDPISLFFRGNLRVCPRLIFYPRRNP